MNTVDFINIRGQQSFLENSINPNEIKIETVTVKKMIEKYKEKTWQNLHLKVSFFQVQCKTTPKKNYYNHWSVRCKI